MFPVVRSKNAREADRLWRLKLSEYRAYLAILFSWGCVQDGQSQPTTAAYNQVSSCFLNYNDFLPCLWFVQGAVLLPCSARALSNGAQPLTERRYAHLAHPGHRGGNHRRNQATEVITQVFPSEVGKEQESEGGRSNIVWV